MLQHLWRLLWVWTSMKGSHRHRYGASMLKLKDKKQHRHPPLHQALHPYCLGVHIMNRHRGTPHYTRDHGPHTPCCSTLAATWTNSRRPIMGRKFRSLGAEMSNDNETQF